MMRTLIVSIAVLLAVVSLRAQNAPRLPWGDPDLEGIWTNATLTTLQRAPELGTKAFFTPEEAAAWEKQRVAGDQRRPPAPRRRSRRLQRRVLRAGDARRQEPADVAHRRSAGWTNPGAHSRRAAEGRRAAEARSRESGRSAGRSVADGAMHPVRRDRADAAGALQQQLPRSCNARAT